MFELIENNPSKFIKEMGVIFNDRINLSRKQDMTKKSTQLKVLKQEADKFFRKQDLLEIPVVDIEFLRDLITGIDIAARGLYKYKSDDYIKLIHWFNTIAEDVVVKKKSYLKKLKNFKVAQDMGDVTRDKVLKETQEIRKQINALTKEYVSATRIYDSKVSDITDKLEELQPDIDILVSNAMLLDEIEPDFHFDVDDLYRGRNKDKLLRENNNDVNMENIAQDVFRRSALVTETFSFLKNYLGNIGFNLTQLRNALEVASGKIPSDDQE